MLEPLIEESEVKITEVKRKLIQLGPKPVDEWQNVLAGRTLPTRQLGNLPGL
jgi:hypothetical protein